MRYTLIFVSCLACVLGLMVVDGMPGAQAPRPNIILILADDLSSNLLDPPGAPVPGFKYSTYHGVEDMMKEGAIFANYFVTNSLCCPSRYSIFTGKFPHNTGVWTNSFNPAKGIVDGGFGAFQANSDFMHTFALALHGAGYNTAMLGKYLNGYSPYDTKTPYAAWGWTDWFVAGDGYPEFIYDLNENNTVIHKGIGPGEYMTYTLRDEAKSLITSYAHASKPFFIEIATFAPHEPYRPPYDKENACPDAKLDFTAPIFRIAPAAPPDWLKDIPKPEQYEKDAYDNYFRLRCQSGLAIDQMISEIRTLVKTLGIENNTYVFFSSDNGYHMGEYSLRPGKMTPYDTDIRVPLVVVGPGVKRQIVSAVAEEIDLAPTFTEIAGNSSPTQPDGHSLMSVLEGRPTPPTWRTMALIEHHGPPDDFTDPDRDPDPGKRHLSGDPPDYAALRIIDKFRGINAMYVEYNFVSNVGGPERNYYDLRTTPDELDNTWQSLTSAAKAALHQELVKYTECGTAHQPACP